MLVSISKGTNHALAQHSLGPSQICLPKGGGSLDGKLLLVSCGSAWVSYYIKPVRCRAKVCLSY